MSQTLTVQAEQRLNKYCDALAKAYGIDISKLDKQFSVTGPVETTLRSALLASVEFLGLITCLMWIRSRAKSCRLAWVSSTPVVKKVVASRAKSVWMATPTN